MPCHFVARLSVARETIVNGEKVASHLILAEGSFVMLSGAHRICDLTVTPIGVEVLLDRLSLFPVFRMGLVTVVTGGVRSVSMAYIG